MALKEVPKMPTGPGLIVFSAGAGIKDIPARKRLGERGEDHLGAL